jgi:hypothetical protein
MKPIYTSRHLEFLSTGYATLTAPELTRAFSARFGLAVTETAIRTTLTRHGIACGRKTGKTKGRYAVVTKEQAQFIIDRYPELTRPELLAEFNLRFGTSLKPSQLKSFITNHHINSGRTGCFPKGHISWNTGTKGVCHGSCTSFKKGNKPANLMTLGTERLTRNGYIQVKIAERNPYAGFPTRWKEKHVVIWEREHGPVPKGYAVAFIDGKKLNCAPENLMLVTRAELLRLNKYHYVDHPQEIKPSVLALAKLEVKTFTAMREI